MSEKPTDEDEATARGWLNGKTGSIYLTQQAREKLLPSLARLVAYSREMGEFDCEAHAELLSLQREQLKCSCNYDRPGMCLWHARMIEERVSTAREQSRQAGAEEMREACVSAASYYASHDVRCGVLGRCVCADMAGQIVDAIRALPLPEPPR